MTNGLHELRKILRNRALMVCLLGYFVDQYDLGLFAINRIASLKSLGLEDASVLNTGIELFNLQMLGMLLGGMFGGVLGDKRGRVFVLYGSMALYASANLANAFVNSVALYAVCRFVSGFGLAAEIGASVTILAEAVPASSRNLSMMVLIAIGHAGGVLAATLCPHLDWRLNYAIGGVLGWLLLGLRLRVQDSTVYLKARAAGARLGSVRVIFATRRSSLAFFKGVLIGLPVYAVSGILLGFAPEIGRSVGIHEPISPALTFPCYYGAVILGDFMSGYLSVFLRSSKKAIFAMQLLMIATGVFFFSAWGGAVVFYVALACLGFASGHWVLVNLVATEQFGTNVRSTVATATPNFIRASAVVMTLSFGQLKNVVSVDTAALIVAGVCLGLSIPAVIGLRETYATDLDFFDAR